MCEERKTVWARWLVEDQQLGPGRERGDQLDLLPVPLGERPDLLPRVEPEALHQPVAVGDVGPAVEPGEELEGLRGGHRRPQEGLASDVGDTAVRGDRLAPGVHPEQLRPSGRRPVEAEQQADCGGLAGAVGAEIAVDLARSHG
jgi:hypothetical protein